MAPKDVDTKHASEHNAKSGLKVGSSERVVYLPEDILGGCGWPTVENDVIKDESGSA